jgi:hypothetical protein
VPSITVIFFTCVRPLIDAPAKPQNYTSLTDAIQVVHVNSGTNLYG